MFCFAFQGDKVQETSSQLPVFDRVDCGPVDDTNEDNSTDSIEALIFITSERNVLLSVITLHWQFCCNFLVSRPENVVKSEPTDFPFKSHVFSKHWVLSVTEFIVTEKFWKIQCFDNSWDLIGKSVCTDSSDFSVPLKFGLGIKFY